MFPLAGTGLGSVLRRDIPCCCNVEAPAFLSQGPLWALCYATPLVDAILKLQRSLSQGLFWALRHATSLVDSMLKFQDRFSMDGLLSF